MSLIRHSDHYRTGPYRDFEQEHCAGGTFGIDIFQVRQDAIETVDPATGDEIFGVNIVGVDRIETDFGDGWKSHQLPFRALDLQPAYAEAHFRLPAVELRLAAVPAASLRSVLESHDLARDALNPATQAFQNLPRAIAAHDAMWHAAKRDDPAASLDLDAAFLTMLGELISSCGHALPPAPRLSDARLARAVDYAETHIAAQLSVGELAAAAAMSPSAFSRAFKAATGETPWHYIRRRRLERAGEMLHRTDASLFDIAVRCGFADASHLARCWKAAHGTTPRGRE